MTDGESAPRILTARSWTRAAAVLPVSAVATIVACSVAAGLTTGAARFLLLPVVLLLGAAAGLLWSRARGAEAVHRAVATARRSAADSHPGDALDADGDADPRASALATPRGWRVESARGRLRFALPVLSVHAETWVLRAVVGSRRAPRRREVVIVDLPTGAVRAHFALGVVVDSMLVAPAWAGSRDGRPDPVWASAVRERLAMHDDLPGALTVGDDRIVLLALDDPRPATTRRRAALVRDIAAIIDGSARPSS